MTLQPSGILALPFTCVALYTLEEALIGLEFLPPSTELKPVQPGVARDVEEQLHTWSQNPHHQFNLPYIIKNGTAFQHRVWKAMCEIPVGETRSYGLLAQQLNSSPRAVGGACGRNPLPIIIPCHRITAKHALGGFNQQQSGWLIDVKRWLLTHEQKALL